MSKEILTLQKAQTVYNITMNGSKYMICFDTETEMLVNTNKDMDYIIRNFYFTSLFFYIIEGKINRTSDDFTIFAGEKIKLL